MLIFFIRLKLFYYPFLTISACRGRETTLAASLSKCSDGDGVIALPHYPPVTLGTWSAEEGFKNLSAETL